MNGRDTQRRTAGNGGGSSGNWGLGVMVAAIIVMMTGCAPRVTQDVREVRTDTVYVGHTERDSIWVRDSVMVREYVRGETVFVDRTRWRERLVDRMVRDTVFVGREETLSKERVVIREPSRWERWKKTAIDIAVTVAVMAVGALFLWLVWRPKMRKQ